MNHSGKKGRESITGLLDICVKCYIYNTSHKKREKRERQKGKERRRKKKEGKGGKRREKEGKGGEEGGKRRGRRREKEGKGGKRRKKEGKGGERRGRRKKIGRRGSRVPFPLTTILLVQN